MSEYGSCVCLVIGAKDPDIIHELDLGRDEADGRYADVDFAARAAVPTLVELRIDMKLSAGLAGWKAVIDAAARTRMRVETA